jgi:fumarate reductase flavoprotein subunit
VSLRVPLIVVGAGACGLVAALAARDAGAEVLMLERDASPSGSTALSSGFIPAALTRFQREAGVEDSPERMKEDILRKNRGEADARLVGALCRASGPAIEWLAERHGVDFELVRGFLYPGHSALRMHAVKEKTGAALMAALLRAASAAGIDLLCLAKTIGLMADSSAAVAGVRFERPDGSLEEAACDAVVLACSGFGGNRAMVKKFIPEMAEALYFGHAGNQGDAVAWGSALGAALADMGAYQGHGSVATPHGILITWALMMEGGIQVNSRGVRFSNEHQGYSEQCLEVLRQPGGFAWNVYDERLHHVGMGFPDYQEAVAAGAVRSAPDIEGLCTQACRSSGCEARCARSSVSPPAPAAIPAAATSRAMSRFRRRITP